MRNLFTNDLVVSISKQRQSKYEHFLFKFEPVPYDSAVYVFVSLFYCFSLFFLLSFYYVQRFLRE